MKKIIFGAGCFWGVEKTFSEIKGVLKTEVGYAQGNTKNPTYEEVCKGDTNHAEVIYIEYDPFVISFNELVNIFYKTHDPTTLNQQGPDRGSQYRSVIAYYDDTQLEVAKQITDKLNESKFNQKITTVIEPVKNYCPAEDYHQKYMERKYSFLNF